MKAVDSTRAKFSTWAMDWRAFEMLDDNEDSMMGGSRSGQRQGGSGGDAG
jgi:hypothetical protein